MYEHISFIIIEFFCFSVIGWIWETVVAHVYPQGHHVGKPFYFGPIKPLYGVGGVVLVELCRQFTSEPLLIFFASIVIATLVELFASIFLMHFFHERVWDYRRSNVINVSRYTLNGHISLVVSVTWGMMTCFVFYVFVPYFDRITNYLIDSFSYLPALILTALFLIDNIFSIKKRFLQSSSKSKKSKSSKKSKRRR
jgi:uncharacterized membrane protein